MSEEFKPFFIEHGDKRWIIVMKKMQYDALMNPDPKKSGEWMKMIGKGHLIADDNIYMGLMKLAVLYQREEFGISSEDVQSSEGRVK